MKQVQRLWSSIGSRTLRKQITVLILVVWSPFAILGIGRVIEHYRHEVRIMTELNRNFAAAVGAAFTNLLNNVWDVELALGLAITQSELGPTQVQRLLEQQLGSREGRLGFCSLSWVDPQGKVLASTSEESRGASFALEDCLLRVVAGEERVISDVQPSVLVEHLAVATGHAIRDEGGKLLGVVIGTLDIQQLGSWLTAGRDTGDFALLDGQGAIVYHQPDGKGAQSPTAGSRPVWLERLLARDVLASGTVSVDKVRASSAGAIVPLAGSGWTVVSSGTGVSPLAFPEDHVLKDVVLWITAAACAWLFADAWVSVVTRKVKRLQQAVTAMSEGELSVAVNLEGNDELAATARMFNKMAQRIRESEVERERFLQISAHELRNPMAAIKGVAQMVRLKLEKGEPFQNSTWAIGLVEQEVDRLSSFLEEVIVAFRVQSNQLEVRRQLVELNKVVAEAVAPFLAGKDSDRFRMDLRSDKPVWVQGDSARLGEVVHHLIDNAVKYSPAAASIQIALATREDAAVVSVKDNGMGIAAQHLSSIFEPFYRTPETIREVNLHGLGLGLYVSAKIVKLHGGRITVESTPGRGTTFAVHLPLAVSQDS